jgi:hypothetical protein
MENKMENSLRDLSIEIQVDGVVWQLVESLDQAGAGDGVYVIDREASRIRFGDGQHGTRPPAGSRLSTAYRSGTGAAGNIASISWIIPASGSPDSQWFTWQLSPDSISISELTGNTNSLRWRFLSWLCRLLCRSPWSAA